MAALLQGAALSAAEPLDEPWDIVSNSTSVERQPDGSRLLRFVGDVVITHGEMTATGEQARYLEGPRRAVLIGDVVMRQDSTVVRGPYATYDRETGVARFPHGVLIERPSGTAVADAGIWRRGERRMELRGEASAADTSGTVDAETMTYDMDAERFWAVGDARMVDDVSGVIVRGQNLRYERADARAVATGEPSAVFADSDVDVHVTSDRMTYDPQRKEAVAVGNVHIRRETMEATCGTAFFYRADDRVVLTDGPEMVDGPTVVRGDRIEMLVPGPGKRTVRVLGAASVSNRFLEGRERPLPPEAETAIADSLEAGVEASLGEGVPADVERSLRVIHEARDRVKSAADAERTPEEIVEEALELPLQKEPVAEADSTGGEEEEEVDARPDWLKTPSDLLPTENLLFGDEMTMYFEGNDMDRVDVVGNGRSKFFPNEETGEFTEWNDVVGDTLNVWFTENDVDSVHVLGNGVGEYRFPLGDLTGGSDAELRELGKLVDYRAPLIRYIRAKETMHLDEGAEVSYKTMTLTSERIDFDAERETMTADGDPAPVLLDRDDVIFGRRMNYHLPSGTGEIETGKTRFDAGYYKGEDVWKMGDDVLAVDHASFTTCDLDNPHYYFACRHMKIYLDDKMVARPVVLKVRNIPLLALPFYMTSLRKDRHSGFLLPNLELGVDDDRGRFIRNMGYYWAPNDYTDLTATMDFYPARDQFVGYLTSRYNVRYRFQGEVRLKYNRDASIDRKESAVEIQHSQDFNRTTRLTADARFLSSKSIYQEIDDAQRLNRDLRSHATFTKQLEGSRNLRVEVNRQENLDSGALTETLPTIQFTQPSIPITGRKTRGAADAEDGGSWLDDVYWKLDGRAVNQRRVDTTGGEERHIGSTADGRLTSTQDILRYLRISPSANFEGTWIDEDRTGKTNAFRGTYNGSLTARTDLYGTMLRPVGPVRGFRHVIRPSVSWNWAPEFREYFFADSTGTLQDRFFAFGGIRGTQRKTNRMNLSVGNLIQTKVTQAEQEKRYDLFNLSSSISYDFLSSDVGRKPWSTLSNRLTVLSSSPVNQTWSASHNPYTWNLLSTSVTTRMSLNSRMFGGPDGSLLGAPGQGGGGDAFGEYGEAWDDPVGAGRGTELPSGHRFTPGEWQAQISHTANHTPPSGSSSSHLVASGTWSPTALWRLSFDYNYDLKNGTNTSQQFSLHRIVHCWEISFDRRLLGGDWQYYLRINVTDLPDLQVERGDRTSGRGFGTSRLPGF